MSEPLLEMKQVLELPLVGSALAPAGPQDELSMHFSKQMERRQHGPYGEFFFFFVEEEPNNNFGNFIRTSFELYDFMRVVEQESVFGHLPDYGLLLCSDPAWTSVLSTNSCTM